LKEKKLVFNASLFQNPHSFQNLLFVIPEEGKLPEGDGDQQDDDLITKYQHDEFKCPEKKTIFFNI
jgi:hypothetical protein